jgi:hypothetical protein
LTERWNGTSWSEVDAPDPSVDVPPTQYSQGFGVSCTGTSNCFLVGVYFNALYTADLAFIEQWNGSSWSIVSDGLSNSLEGVSCATATSCFAVGSAAVIARYS